MAQYIEDFLPPLQSTGLNTLENTSLGGTLAVTGASTFTGAATFASTPTFSSGINAGVLSNTTVATLTAAQTGSTVVFNSTTGVRITLPVPVAGLTYNFVVAATPAAGTHGITTTASTFISGPLTITAALAGGTGATFVGTAATTISVAMNGTTTGGIAGSAFTATAISSTVWQVDGTLIGSGILATPFTN